MKYKNFFYNYHCYCGLMFVLIMFNNLQTIFKFIVPTPRSVTCISCHPSYFQFRSPSEQSWCFHINTADRSCLHYLFTNQLSSSRPYPKQYVNFKIISNSSTSTISTNDLLFLSQPQDWYFKTKIMLPCSIKSRCWIFVCVWDIKYASCRTGFD